MVKFGSLELSDEIAPLWLVLTNANEDLSTLEIVMGDFLGCYPDESESERRERIAGATARLCELSLIELLDTDNAIRGDHGRVVPLSTVGEVARRSDPAKVAVWCTERGQALWLQGPSALAREAESFAVQQGVAADQQQLGSIDLGCRLADYCSSGSASVSTVPGH